MATCAWTCDPGYTGRHCLSPLEDFFDVFGGKLAFTGLLLGLVLCVIAISVMYKKETKDAYVIRRDQFRFQDRHVFQPFGHRTSSEMDPLLLPAVDETAQLNLPSRYRYTDR
jgi:hypothetical protein